MQSKYFLKNLAECEWVTVTRNELSRLKFFCLLHYNEGRIQMKNQQVSTCTLAAYHKHILKMLQVKEPLPVSQNFDEPASKKCKTDKIHVEIKTELASDKSSVIILQLSIH